MVETLVERQIEREKLQVENGITRYHKHRDQKDEADMTPGKILVKRAVEPVAAAITEMVERVESGKAGRGKPAAVTAYLCQLQAEPVAYITARILINAAGKEWHAPKTAMALASLIEEHYTFDELRLAEPNLANAMERKAKKWSTPHHRRAIMRRAADVASVTGLGWKQGDKLRLGMKLIELFIETTGLVELVMIQSGRNKRATIVRPTEATCDWLANLHGRCELLEPRFTPMLCPPVPWTNPLRGGYLTQENRVDFIGGSNAAFRDEAFNVQMPDVYRAINTVQATPWRINKAVFDVLDEAWHSRSTLGGLPQQENHPLPERPADIPRDMRPDDMDDSTRRRFEQWIRETANTHEMNASLVSKRIAVIAQLSMASDVKDEEQIYFPHNVDFRGRMYSVVPGLSPQADDQGKALLEFAEGKPLGESGGYWLMVHIANLFGVDKCSFDERVQWVQDNSLRLLGSALNPLDGDRFWCEADDPWCALAACFEYAGWHITGWSEDYVSHLPIAMDGSCSGLQHYSAMLRDSDGGRAVNLLPTDQPADLYTEVADRVEIWLNDPELSTNQLAQAWRNKVSRKIVKRPCMTFAYSVTSRGMRDQILDECRKQADGGEYLPGYDNFSAATFLAPLVEKAIRETVDRAAEAMDWLKEAVRVYVEADVPVNWFTPDGFPVQHRYVKTNGKRFKVWFNGVRMDVQLRVETTKPDLRKQVSSIAPNFIHSMDAVHLRRVANRMHDSGITNSFATIHDSFGVHACDVDELHYAIRDEFINMYTDDQLVGFRKQVLGYVPQAELAEPPSPGTLDLEDIRTADFFFS